MAWSYVALNNGGLFKYDFDINSLEFSNPEILMKSHFAVQECGMTIYENNIFTSGDDNQMIQHDYKTHEITGLFKLNNQKKEPTVSKDLFKTNKLLTKAAGKIMKRKDIEVHDDFESDISINEIIKHIAMSYKDGQVLVKSFDDPSKLLFTLSEATKSCEWVEYSPNNEKLACGSHDKKIYIYNCQEYKYDLFRIYEFHSGGIVAIDWCI